MHVIRARNVNQILPIGLRYLRECGIPQASRAGDVYVAPGPVTTVFENPCERVLFWPERDANPWLHCFEALWMLAGRNDLGFLTQFVKRFAEYSDDGETLHGAYGHRLRNHFGKDQLQAAIDELRNNPSSRRVVLTLWDPDSDLGRDGKDLPCNQQLFLNVGYGRANERNRLHMMVTCRSHDIIWGCYGANAVHFSFIHEYLAAHLGLEVGNMTFVSMNYHAYRGVYDKLVSKCKLPVDCPYTLGAVNSWPIIEHAESWDEDLLRFLDDPESSITAWRNSFFRCVARPMWMAHVWHKERRPSEALLAAGDIIAPDWRRAALEWLERRTTTARRRSATGQEHPFGYDAEIDS